MSQTDFYLKLGAFEGEATAKGVEKHIEIEAFSFAIDNASSFARGGGLAAGKASASPLTFTKFFDKSTPMIYKACASGQHIDKAELQCRKNTGEGGDETYLKITLTEVLVSNSSSSGAGQGSVPMDSFTLSYNKIEMEYLSQDPKSGKLGNPSKMSFDIKTSKAA